MKIYLITSLHQGKNYEYHLLSDNCDMPVFINSSYYHSDICSLISSYLTLYTNGIYSTASATVQVIAKENNYSYETLLEFKDADDLKEKYPEYLI